MFKTIFYFIFLIWYSTELFLLYFILLIWYSLNIIDNYIEYSNIYFILYAQNNIFILF